MLKYYIIFGIVVIANFVLFYWLCSINGTLRESETKVRDLQRENRKLNNEIERLKRPPPLQTKSVKDSLSTVKNSISKKMSSSSISNDWYSGSSNHYNHHSYDSGSFSSGSDSSSGCSFDSSSSSSCD